jgi:dihydrofolate reductase
MNHMRKLFLHMMVSLDGYIEDANKEIDWSRELGMDEEFEDYSNEMLRSIGGMVLGRKIYQLYLGYWPKAFDNPAGAADHSNPERHLEAARLLHKKPKYVVSNTLKEAKWNQVQILSGDLEIEIKKLKDQPGKDLVIFGGASLACSLMELNLIDEYRLIVNPVILGGGTPLFCNELSETKLILSKTRKFKSGAILLVYNPL